MMAENESEEGEEKKSSKKIIIIVAVILLLAGAGAGAGYFFMAGDTEQSDGEDTEQIEEEDNDEDAAATNEIYFDMAKPLIVNFSKGSEARLIQVSVSLLVKGDETVEALKKHEPMIRNNLLMAISAKGAKNLKTREGKEELRSEMLKEVGKVLEKMSGKNDLSNLFFTTFVMQ